MQKTFTTGKNKDFLSFKQQNLLRKRIYSLFLIFLLLCACLFTSCPNPIIAWIAFDKSGVDLKLIPLFTSIEDAIAWLALQPNGTQNNPVSLALNINLGTMPSSEWLNLLTEIERVGKYVNLDLSACGMDTTVFNLNSTVQTGKDRIVSLVLPNEAIIIANGTFPNFLFNNFDSLTSVTGRNVITIGEWTFMNRITLQSISFPAAESIGYMSFGGCRTLAHVNLPRATTIGQQAFSGCTALTNINLPMATTIDSRAFYNCTALTNKNLPMAKTIESNAFYQCIGLTTVNFPSAIYIGEFAFIGCTALRTVNLPEVITIEHGAFLSCTALQTVNLPKATDIGINTLLLEQGVFSKCTALQTVNLPMAINIGDSTFDSCTALQTINLPAAEIIGLLAFGKCTALHTVDLPVVTEFDQGAFYSTGDIALSITLGDIVPTMDERLFSDVNSPKSVTVRVPNVPAWDLIVSSSPYDNLDTTSNNWGNAFRGIGWNGTTYLGDPVNDNITLVVTH